MPAKSPTSLLKWSSWFEYYPGFSLSHLLLFYLLSPSQFPLHQLLSSHTGPCLFNPTISPHSYFFPLFGPFQLLPFLYPSVAPSHPADSIQLFQFLHPVMISPSDMSEPDEQLEMFSAAPPTLWSGVSATSPHP